MREILFRGKTEYGSWVYGDLIHYESGEVAILERPFSKYGYEAVECGRRTKVLPDTLCQYTGLTDKNGNKIWENDIVRYTDEIINKVKEDLIEWNETHASFIRLHKSQMGLQYLYFNEGIANQSEVIGNYIDNPELLKGG